MVFGRGTSEMIVVQTIVSESVNFRNVFSVGYMPPRNERGEELTGMTIMRNGNVNGNPPSSPNRNNRNESSRIIQDCGDHPVGSFECAFSKLPTNRQFSIEITKPDGSRRTYAGEFIKIGQEAVILHVTITGASAESNGEWWDKLSGEGRTTDANNTFRKVNGVWSRVRTKPKEQEYQNLFFASGVVQPIDIGAAYAPVKIGEEAINGENCNHFQIKYIADGSRSVTDVWVSKRTGYAMRRKMKTPAGTTIVNESRQGETINIETPAGAR